MLRPETGVGFPPGPPPPLPAQGEQSGLVLDCDFDQERWQIAAGVFQLDVYARGEAGKNIGTRQDCDLEGLKVTLAHEPGNSHKPEQR